MIRNIATACAAIAVFAAPLSAHSQQAYPTKPIRMLVGFTPGSEIDVMGRLVAPELSDRLGQRVVVDNRSGAGGTVAGAIAATAAADGYTLFLNSVAHAASAAPSSAAMVANHFVSLIIHLRPHQGAHRPFA